MSHNKSLECRANLMINRRRFTRRLVFAAAGMMVPFSPVFVRFSSATAQKPTELAMVSGPDYPALVREALRLIGGMEQFVRPGDSVVVKPNIAWDRPPELAATTHPQVVGTVVELVLAAGAKQVTIFDHTCNEPRRCYVNSGMTELVETLRDRRVRLEHMDRRKFVRTPIPAGRSLQEWEIYQDILTADCHINVPIAKHHGLSRLTLGLKNVMGVIGGNRGRLHHGLAQNLADLATVIRPTVTLVDATRILMDNGPQGGRLEDVRRTDTVIASADPVAADAVATTLFGLRPEEIETTVAAARMGLGEMDMDRITVREHRL